MSYKTYEVRIYDSGTKEWYLNGKLHREDGPAIEWNDGSKWWFLKGKLHCEDGPAVEYADGTKHWYLNGKRHREDGPAIESYNGTKLWYLNGKSLTKEEWEKQVNKAKEETIIIDGKEFSTSTIKAALKHYIN